jgi:hypothetical protein
MAMLWGNIEWSDSERPAIRAFDKARAQGQSGLDEFFASPAAPKTKTMANVVFHHALRQTDLAAAKAARRHIRSRGWGYRYHDPKTGWLTLQEVVWRRSFAPGSPARALADWLVAGEELNFYVCHRADAEGNVVAHNHDRLIHSAIEMNNVELLDWTLERGGCARGGGGEKAKHGRVSETWPDETPLALASRLGRPEMVAKLLAAGAKPGNAITRGGKRLHKPPLAAAVEAGDWECAKLVASALGPGALWKDGDVEALVSAKTPSRAPAQSPGHARIWVAAQASGVLRAQDHKRAELQKIAAEASALLRSAEQGEEAARAAESEGSRDARAAAREEPAGGEGLLAEEAEKEAAKGMAKSGFLAFFRRALALGGRWTSEGSTQENAKAASSSAVPKSLEGRVAELRAKAQENQAAAAKKERLRESVRLGNAIASGDAEAARAAMAAINRSDALTYCGLPMAFVATALAVAAFDAPKTSSKAQGPRLADAGMPDRSPGAPESLSKASRLSTLAACARQEGPAGDAFRKQLRAPMDVLGGMCCANVAALFNAPGALLSICEASAASGAGFSKSAPEPLATAALCGAQESVEALLALGEAGGDPSRAGEALLASVQGDRMEAFWTLAKALETAAGGSPQKAAALSSGLAAASDFAAAKQAEKASAKGQGGGWPEWARSIERARLSLEASVASLATRKQEGSDQPALARSRGGLRL